MAPEHASTTVAAEPEFWQSVDQWMDTPQFREMVQNEFPEDAAEWVDPVSRRQFLTLMGASVALAGAVGCNPSFKPASQRKAIPYVHQPDQILPGVPLFFATAMPQAGGLGLGLLVKSVEGRPIKCEGNPNHPSSRGAIDLQALAAPLSFYDPERSQACRMGETATTPDKAIAAFKDVLNRQAEKLPAERGDGIRLLTEPTTSPTLIRLMDEFLKRNPAAKWIQYEPIGSANSRKGLLAAFGKPLVPLYDFEAADVVLSLDADFLNGPGHALKVVAEGGVHQRHVLVVLRQRPLGRSAKVVQLAPQLVPRDRERPWAPAPMIARLMGIIGSTQGVRVKASPPRKTSRRMARGPRPSNIPFWTEPDSALSRRVLNSADER